MGPLIPLAALGLGGYIVKRWFDKKEVLPKAPGATGYAENTQGLADPSQAAQGASSGGGGGGGQAPGDPGYPMNTDPTYTGAPNPLSLGQIFSSIQKANTPRTVASRMVAQGSAPLGTFTQRADALPAQFIAPAPAPTNPFAAISKAVAPAPMGTLPQPGSFTLIKK